MSALFQLKMAVREHPLTLKHYYVRQESPWMKRRVVRPGDDAVIEGFPRSANTFASYAFLDAQGDKVRFGNHFHNSAQFVLARRYGIPAMLVIREPIGAALSFMIFSGNMGAAEALGRYIAFHKPLLKIRDSFTVAPFDEVTRDFGQSIDRMNAKFGTAFARFAHDEASAQHIFDRIAADRAKRAEKFGDTFRNPLKTTTPTAEKKAKQAELEASFDDPALAPLKARAHAIHQQLLAGL